MRTAIADADDRRLPLTSMWLLWIAVSAAIPALGVLRAVLMERNFASHFQGLLTVIIFATLVAALAPAVIQALVLRRLVPQMSMLIWLGASWISAIFAVFLIDALRRKGFGSEFAYEMARLRLKPGGLTWSAMAWAWLHLIAHTATVSLIYSAAPLLAFGWMAKRPVRAFLIATVAGACVAMVLYQLYPGFRQMGLWSYYSPIDTTRAQSSWRHIAEICAAVAVLGMVQGAIGGYGLARMFASPAEPLRTRAVVRVAGVVALVLVAAHSVRYVFGPYGYQAGFPDIRRTFSAPPAIDRSQGAAILSFSEKVVLPGPAWYAAPSSDARNVLVQMKDKTIRMITPERRFTQTQMSIGESARSMVFSADGRHAAVNQQGARRGERDFHFGRVLVLLLAADGYEEIRDFRNTEQNCAFSSTMTFSADSRLLWVACERSTAKPNDLLAVALRVPDLAIVERRSAPVVLGGRGSVSDIMSTAAGTFVTLFDWPERPHRIVVLDVDKPEPVFTSGDVAAAEVGGEGFGFCGLHLSSEAALVTLAHCALHDVMRKHDMYKAKGQFRTFDTRSGALVADFARQGGKLNGVQWTSAFDRGRGRFATWGTTLASRTGALAIWDQRTGKELQNITTAAYRVGRFSLDGRWLVLLHRDEDAISFYRAAP